MEKFARSNRNNIESRYFDGIYTGKSCIGDSCRVMRLFGRLSHQCIERARKSLAKFERRLAGFVSALAFGSVTVINKYVVVEVGVYSQQVLWAFSITATLLLYCLFYKNIREIKVVARRDIVLGLVSGLVYLGASFFMLESYKYIPASIGFTIIQLNTVWTFIAGVFFFHEIDALRHYKRLILGVCFSLAGITLLFLA